MWKTCEKKLSCGKYEEKWETLIQEIEFLFCLMRQKQCKIKGAKKYISIDLYKNYL